MDSKEDCKAICTGCIVGIVISCLIIGILLGIVFIFFWKKRRTTLQTNNNADKTNKVFSEKTTTTNENITALELLLYEDIHPKRIKIQIELDFYKNFCRILSILCTKTKKLHLEHLENEESRENNFEKSYEKEQKITSTEEQLFYLENLYEKILVEINKTKIATESFDKKIQMEILSVIESWKQTLNIDFTFISTLISYNTDVNQFCKAQKYLNRLLKIPNEQLNEKCVSFYYSLYTLEKDKLKTLSKIIEDLNSVAEKRIETVKKYFILRETKKFKWNDQIAEITNLVTLAKKRLYIDDQKCQDLINEVLNHMNDFKSKFTIEKEFEYEALRKKIKLKSYDIKLLQPTKSKEKADDVFNIHNFKILVFHLIKTEKEFDEYIITELELLNKSFSIKIEKEIVFVKENIITSLKNNSQLNEVWLNDQIRKIEEFNSKNSYDNNISSFEIERFGVNIDRNQIKLIKILQKQFGDENSRMDFLLCELSILFDLNIRYIC